MWLRMLASSVTLSLGMVLPACTPQEPPAPKIARVGILTPAFQPHLGLVALRDELRNLGYVEGRNLVVEFRSAEGNEERLPALAEELVHLKVDVIVADLDRSAREVQRLTATIPIVVTTGDPVAAGLVANAARPGANSTGVGIVSPELTGKRLEMLKDAMPGVSRVAYLWHGCGVTCDRDLQSAKRAAAALGMQLIPVEVADPWPLEKAFAAMAEAHADAFVPMPSPVFVSLLPQIVALSTQRRLPGIFFEREFVEAGGLIAYGPSVPTVFRHAARYVDKILRGTKPADLPIWYPRNYDLFINQNTANALGLTIPKSVLARAEVIAK